MRNPAPRQRPSVGGGRALAGAAFTLGLVAGLAALRTFGFYDAWESRIFGSDFSLIWTGPHVFLTGGDPYDRVTWQRAILESGVQATSTPVFIYPGWVPLILAPFGALPLVLSAQLWLGLTLIFGAIGLFALLDDRARELPLAHTLLGFALVASDPGIVTFYSGQWSFLLVGALSLMALWFRRRGVLSGAAASAMLLKPQLFLVALPALVRLAMARRERGFIAALTAVGILAVVTSAIAFPGWWNAYVDVPTTQAGDSRAATLPNALRDLVG